MNKPISDNTIIAVLKECNERSLAGTIAFPEIIGKLTACGVESYHADLYRQENTYYLPSGDNHVEAVIHEPHPVASVFCAESVREAVRDSQQGKIKYTEFLRRVQEAGTTQYFVYLTGKCVVYIGRDGSQHVEHFPRAT